MNSPSEENPSAADDANPAPAYARSLPSRFIRPTAYLIMAGLSVVFIFRIVALHGDIESTKRNLEKASAQYKANAEELSTLTEAKLSLRDREKNVNWIRNRLVRIHNSYRDIDDFPRMDSPFVIAAVKNSGWMNDTLNLTVPDGKHRLVISLTKTNRDTKEVIEDKELEYALAPSSSYIVKFNFDRQPGKKYRDPRQLELEITSNAEEFEPVSLELFDPMPPNTGGSSVGGRKKSIFLPNEYDQWSKEAGILVNGMRWTASQYVDHPFDIAFKIVLHSDGPMLAGETEASSHRYMKGLSVKYLERGISAIEKVPESK